MKNQGLIASIILGLFLTLPLAQGGIPLESLPDDTALSDPLWSGTYPTDPLDFLPQPLTKAIGHGDPLSYHEAQIQLIKQTLDLPLLDASPPGHAEPLESLTESGSGGTHGEEPVRTLLDRLGIPLDPEQEGLLDVGLGLLDHDQQRLVHRITTAYLDALNEEGPLTARAHFAALAADPILQAPLSPGPLLLDACGAVYLDLSHTDNVHECDYLLMIDAGGDDLYLNNAGGTIRIDGVVPLPTLAVDLGGNDRYVGQTESGGITGGGYGNAAALISAGGDDEFDTTATIGAVNGGGYRGGAGLLVNLAGNDTYQGSVAHGGINGGSGFGGAGLLIDLTGDDTYWGTVSAFGGVNGGSNDGAGGLVDLGQGDDTYDGTVGGRGGVNAGNEQGVAFLVDDGGDDTFNGHVSGGGVNGGAAGKGTAYFISGGGDNIFHGSIGRHGAINGGAYQARAVFLSLGGGDDTYYGTAMKTGAINGAAVLAEALLFDDGGDDRFEGFVQGTGAVNGAGLWGTGHLENLAGDDTYIATVLELDTEELTGETGSATNGGAFLGTGALIDHSGLNWYRENDGPGAWGETVFPKGTLGVQLDLQGATGP